MGPAVVLPPTTAAAAQARRHVTATLRAAGLGTLADDAALAATELVTNVLLHTDSEVRVEVDTGPDSARVLVSDDSPVLPVPGMLDRAGASGRGLVLVERLTHRWGVTMVSGGGKTVWFEIVAGMPEPDADFTADDLIAAWGTEGELPADLSLRHPDAAAGDEGDEPPEDEEQPRLVVLEDLPTELLVATKTRLDELVRELTLLSCGDDAALPEDLRALASRLRRLAVDLAYYRQEVRRQARDAAARGDETLALRLELLPSEARLLAEYREALDEADELCRCGRLLLQPSSEETVTFRRWLLDSVIVQLGG